MWHINMNTPPLNSSFLPGFNLLWEYPEWLEIKLFALMWLLQFRILWQWVHCFNIYVLTSTLDLGLVATRLKLTLFENNMIVSESSLVNLKFNEFRFVSDLTFLDFYWPLEHCPTLAFLLVFVFQNSIPLKCIFLFHPFSRWKYSVFFCCWYFSDLSVFVMKS